MMLALATNKTLCTKWKHTTPWSPYAYRQIRCTASTAILYQLRFLTEQRQGPVYKHFLSWEEGKCFPQFVSLHKTEL